METAPINGLRLEYEIQGTGEPVLLIHGAFLAEMFQPLSATPELTDDYRLIRFHRRGYRGSSPLSGRISVEEHATDCSTLLRHLGVGRAHVVGQSYGGAVALQLALAAPELVWTLALLEPALAVGESAPGYHESLVRGVQRYRELGAGVVLDEFLEARSPGYRALLDEALPGAFARMMTDAGSVFEHEVAALPDWRFDEEEARSINQPTLSVLGGDSEALWPRFGETHRLLMSCLPRAEEFILPATTHLGLIEDPQGLADGLRRFWASHPMSALR